MRWPRKSNYPAAHQETHLPGASQEACLALSEEPEVVCLQEWVLLCLEELMVVCLELDVILNVSAWPLPIFLCLPCNLLIVEKPLLYNLLNFSFVEQDLDLMTTFGDPEVMSALQDCTVFHSNSSLLSFMLEFQCYI
jgi:hypothetical protein